MRHLFIPLGVLVALAPVACSDHEPVAPNDDLIVPLLDEADDDDDDDDGPGVVRSVNGLTGDVNIAAGDNITVTESNNTITIAATRSGGFTGVEVVTEEKFCAAREPDSPGTTCALQVLCPADKFAINGGYLTEAALFSGAFTETSVSANVPFASETQFGWRVLIIQSLKTLSGTDQQGHSFLMSVHALCVDGGA